MKKRLLMMLAILMTITMAKAQSFEFQFQGNKVEDGGTVVIPAVPDDFGFGEFWCETNPSSNPTNGLILKLLSGSTASGSASINIKRNTLSPQTLKWCMGGTCQMMNDKTSLEKTFTVSDGSVQVQFDAENCKNEGDLLATLTATIGSETHTVNILFTYGSTGISNVKTEKVETDYYMLDGRRVERLTKGIYISQGKKIIINR
jgi:hypothetical protein